MSIKFTIRNNKNRNILSVLVLSILISSLFLSCATPLEKANKAFQRGDYTTALKDAIQALKEEPGNGEALYIAKESWKIESSNKETQIQTLLSQDTIESYENLLDVYSAFLSQSVSVQSANIMNIYPIPNIAKINADKTAATNILNEKYINEGKNFLIFGDRENAKTAYSYFIKARNNGYNNPELSLLIKTAKEKATIIVFVAGAQPRNSVDIYPMLDTFAKKIEKDQFIEIRLDDTLNFENMNLTKAINYAKYSGATHLFFMDPGMQYSYRYPASTSAFGSTGWNVKDITIDFDYEIDIQYQIIDLATNQIKSGSYNNTDSMYDRFKVSVVYSDNNQSTIDFGIGIPNNTIERIDANKAPTNVPNALTMAGEFSSERVKTENTSASLVYSMDARPLLNSGRKINLVADLINGDIDLDDISGHTFFLFDAIEFPAAIGVQPEIKFVYTDAIKANTGDIVDDYLLTADYEENLYYDLENVLQINANGTNGIAGDLILLECIADKYYAEAPLDLANKVLQTL